MNADKSFASIATEPTTARGRILTTLRDQGAMTRADLARATGLAPATLTGAVRELLSEGVVVETGPSVPQAPRTGPRGTEVSLNPTLAYALGIDIGLRTFRVMVADAVGMPVGYAEERLEPDHQAAHGLQVIARLALIAMRQAGCSADHVIGAAVAVRGPVDNAVQAISPTGELPGWGGVAAADFARMLGCPVTLENDANLAAWGEQLYGAGRGCHSSIVVKLHSGVGAGLIVADHLVTGPRGGAGELGHVTVVPRGAWCRCGKRGCLDTRASIPALLKTMEPIGVADVASLLTRISQGDDRVARHVEAAATLVGRALVPVTLLLVPERVILVGALARAGRVIADPIRRELTRGAMPGTATSADVRLGELGDRATVQGAVGLVLSTAGWLSRPGDRRLLIR